VSKTAAPHQEAFQKKHLHLAAQQVGDCGSAAKIWSVDHFDSGHHFEQLARDMLHSAAAARGHVDLARIVLGISDELRDGLCRNDG